MKFKTIILFIALSLFVVQPANVLKAVSVSDVLGKAQELAGKQKIKGKKLEEFILNNVITIDYEDKKQTYKFNKDITYEVYEDGKVIGEGSWAIKGLTKNSIKLSGYRDIYFQIYKAKDRISTLTNLKKKNDEQTNRKILSIASPNDFEEQFAQIELEKQKALEQKKKEEEEKKQAALKAGEERKKKEGQEKLNAELDKLKAEKLAELESYKKSNEQLVEKAIQISELLVTLENDREGEKLIDEYNSQIENILTLETKEQIEAFKIDTEMHLSLKAYVEKHEGNISSYQAKIEEVEKQKKAEKEKKRLANAEKKQLKLFGIVTGKKISEYNVKKIIHEEGGMVHVLVDPPVKNSDFEYYRVVYSKPSDVIITVAGYTGQTFGKYNHLDRVSTFVQQTEMDVFANLCDNFELTFVIGAIGQDTFNQEEFKEGINKMFDNLPHESGQQTIKQCYMVSSDTYDINKPKIRVLNEIDDMFENKRVGEKCRTHMTDYIKILKKKYNIPDGKINEYSGKVGVKTKKYPGYLSVFEMERTTMEIEDKNGMIYISCPDSIPDYNNKVRGGVSLVNLELYVKTADDRKKYIENSKQDKIEKQKQEKIRKEQESLDTKDKQGL